MDITKNKKVMILAGGTGGHVMPALAVAQALQQKGIAVHWLGTRAGIEARLVPQANVPLSFIDIQGIRGKKLSSWVSAPFRILRALFQSLKVMGKEQPDAVLSMGGYVAGPGAIAAILLRKPLILHEQNAFPGWTNRLLSGLSKRIMVAFPDVFAQHAQKVIFTGNPIRHAILALHPTKIRLDEVTQAPLHLLVLGGSNGAKTLNETVPKALALIPPGKRPIVWHQCGKGWLDATTQMYEKYQVKAQVTEFIDDMAKAYAFADVVVCRSGALTLAELSAVGLPSILIPFPYAIDDHQTFNAKYLSEKGAAILLPQTALTPEKLRDDLWDLISHPIKRHQMAVACHQLAKPNATSEVAAQCINL